MSLERGEQFVAAHAGFQGAGFEIGRNDRDDIMVQGMAERAARAKLVIVADVVPAACEILRRCARLAFH